MDNGALGSFPTRRIFKIIFKWFEQGALTMKVHVYEIHAFTEAGKGGNAAGVVIQPEAAILTEAQMLDISARMGFSETAFVTRSDLADFKVRFFTPQSEVDLCGHATIGTFWLLEHLGRLEGREELIQETKAGLLRIRASSEEILMEQALPEFGLILEPEEIFWSLGLSEDEQAPGLPVQIVSTGLKDILVPVSSVEALRGIRPDLEEIRKISEAYGVTGYHCFALESGQTMPEASGQPAITAWCRNFAPLFGIDEESATGTSNGALAAYLSVYGAYKCAEGAFSRDSRAVSSDSRAVSSADGTRSNDTNDTGDTSDTCDTSASCTVRAEVMSFAQGMWMGQPSRINARVLWAEDDAEALLPDLMPDGEISPDTDSEKPWINSVWVGGSAVLAGETVLDIE